MTRLKTAFDVKMGSGRSGRNILAEVDVSPRARILPLPALSQTFFTQIPLHHLTLVIEHALSLSLSQTHTYSLNRPHSLFPSRSNTHTRCPGSSLATDTCTLTGTSTHRSVQPPAHTRTRTHSLSLTHKATLFSTWHTSPSSLSKAKAKFLF